MKFAAVRRANCEPAESIFKNCLRKLKSFRASLKGAHCIRDKTIDSDMLHNESSILYVCYPLLLLVQIQGGKLLDKIF